MKRYIIKECKEYQNVKIYTVKFDDEKDNETDRFISRFINDEKYKDDFTQLFIGLTKLVSQEYWIAILGLKKEH